MKKLLIILFVFFGLVSSSQHHMMHVLASQTTTTLTYPVYEDSGGLSAAGDYSVSVNYPGTVNENDILITQLLDADNDAFSAPDGTWTLIYQEGASANASHAYYWKRATGTESGSVIFTSALNAGAGVYGIMSRYSGCITSGTPYEDMSGVAVSQTSTPTIPAMTSTGGYRLAVAFITIEDNVTLSGYNLYLEAYQITSTFGGDANLAAAYQQKLAAGDVSSDVLSLTSSEYTGVMGLLLIPAGGSAPPTTDLKTDLVAVWEYNETSAGDAIDAHGSYDGSNTGATINQTGKIDKAYDYATGDYVSMDGAVWADEADRSVSIWFKLDNITTDHALFSNWGTALSSSGEFIIQFDDVSGKTAATDVVSYVEMTTNGATNGLWCETSVSLTTGTWYNIVFVHEWGVGVDIYLNGVLRNNNSNGNATIAESTTNVRTGYARSNSKDMDGLIDQVATWSRLLTTDDIADLWGDGDGLAYTSW